MSIRAYFATMLLLTTSPVYADILTQNCTAIGELARSIMEKRQSGTDMSVMMSVVDKLDEKDPIKDVGRAMVIEAYEAPLFNGDEFKQRTISEFANKIQVSCYKTAQ
jgi:hypothetical protein